ncbi:MAG: hypothetical protein BZY80_04740 [SAR202 cluster bacterium Io17-Chloro-G2]|nr:MAG: hypothetical protein BZY80_04740 [SAR202 cluster bacterium Io17-Chloro-G2]
MGFFYWSAGSMRDTHTGEVMSKAVKTEYVQLKQAVYREYSRSYDEDRKRFVGGQGLAERVDWALGPLTQRARLLDLGCGSGDVIARALELHPDLVAPVGLDLTPEMLALARTRFTHSCGLVQANAHVDSVAGLPLQDRKFNLVTSLNLIHELPRAAIPGLLDEVHRVLNPGGQLQAVIPCMVAENPSSMVFQRMSWERGAMDFLFPSELKDLLNQGTGLTDRKFKLGPSSAASAAAKGETRFKLFSQIMDELREQGLDPQDVTQGVMYFSASRAG